MKTTIRFLGVVSSLMLLPLALLAADKPNPIPGGIVLTAIGPEPPAVCLGEKCSWKLCAVARDAAFVREEAIPGTVVWTWTIVEVETNDETPDPAAPGWRDDPPSKHTVRVTKTSETTTTSKANLEATFLTPGFKMITVKATLRFLSLKGPFFAEKEIKVEVPAVKIQIDPIQFGLVIGTSDPINRIGNPSGIVILDKTLKPDPDPDQLALTANNVAKVGITKVEPKDFDLTNQVEWSIESVDRVTGKPSAKGGKALFFDGAKNDKATITDGKVVRLFGVEEGRILVTATLKGNKMPCETYEALVVKQRDILFRVQILKGKTVPGSSFTADQAADHIKIANTYLRQVGVRLKPDPVTEAKTVTDGAKLADPNKPGFFTATVADELVLKVEDKTAMDTIRINHRPKVLNICYIQTRPGGKFALAVNFPGNTNGASLTSTYRVTVDEAATQQTLKLQAEKIQPGDKEKAIWGMVVSTGRLALFTNFAPNLGGQGIAHECGHVMNLNHRPGVDGIAEPADRNLMTAEVKFLKSKTSVIFSQDLDLIQCIAVRGSKAFAP